MSQSQISRIETCRTVPAAVDVERLLHALGTGDEERAELLELARVSAVEYQSLRPAAVAGLHLLQDRLRALDESAELTRMFLPAIPTGLLQVEDYARAVLNSRVQGAAVGDVEATVAGRMARQAILEDSSRTFRFLLTESAVRWRRAPLAVMATQCRHMADVASSRPNVEIGVIPLAAPVPVSPLEIFVIYDKRLVRCELHSGTVNLRDPADIELYENLFDALAVHALTGEDAVAFLSATAAGFEAQARYADA